MAEYDLVIRKGLLIDGTGAPGVIGDIAIHAGRIAAMGDLADTPASTSIDASGRVVELRQEGWLIEFEGASDAYPRRIHLSRPDLDLRLVIESLSSGTP